MVNNVIQWMNLCTVKGQLDFYIVCPVDNAIQRLNKLDMVFYDKKWDIFS